VVEPIKAAKKQDSDNGLMVDNDFGDDFDDNYEDDFNASAGKDGNIFEDSRSG